MISCKKATELMEKRAIVGITLFEILQIRIHNYICKVCLKYEVQSKKIDELLSHYSQHEHIELIENPELKELIKKRIEIR